MAAEDTQYMDRLDMDNDYEGGVEIGGEFFFTRKKERRQQTREDQLYGVFAGSSDEEEGGGGRRGRKRKASEADYSQPVAFVSTGETMGGTARPPQHANDGNQQPGASRGGLGSSGAAAEPSASGWVGAGGAFTAARGDLGNGDVDGGRGGLGLGASDSPGPGSRSGLGSGGGGGDGLGRQQPGVGSGGGGPGFRSAGQQVGAAEDEDDEDDVFLPTSFGKSIKAAAEKRRQEQMAKVKTEKKKAAVRQTDLGSFEAHTKGIGAKLLAKMGYQKGEGLGRNKQGIAKAIEVKLRPKGQGLGAGGSEHKLVQDEPTKAEPQQQAAERAVPVALWKKRNAAARVRRDYKTADEVLSEGGDAAPAARMHTTTILDMRGPQARVVTNLEHLNVQDEEEATGDAVPMPELQHNLRLLVDLAEADIRKTDARLRHAQDTAVLLGREEARLRAEVGAAADAEARLAAVVAAMERCQASASDMDALADAYSQLQIQYGEEYLMYNLPAAALAAALPLMRQRFAGWQPLADPDRGLRDMQRWRPLLQSDSARDAIFQLTIHEQPPQAAAEAQDPFAQLVALVMLPPLRTAITNTWQAREPEALLQWLDLWQPLMPPALLHELLTSQVFPKIRVAVEAWNPRTDPVPLHQWLFPWLEHLVGPLEELYPGIRQKLAAALTAWDPYDSSAKALLQPWHRVFDQKSWEVLMSRSIVPKLALALQRLVINPAAQDCTPFDAVLAWRGLVPTPSLVALLEQGFWPQWHAILQHWLAGAPDHNEVARWYLSWKSRFPQDLQDNERIRAQLNAGLNAMHSAADAAAPVTGAGPQPSAAGIHAQPPYSAAGFNPGIPVQPGTRWEEPAMPVQPLEDGDGDFTLRQLVERFAAENGLTFMPKPGRTMSGLQVWAFGAVSIIMDNAKQLIRAQKGEKWVPVSLDDLLSEHKARRKL